MATKYFDIAINVISKSKPGI